MPDKKEPLIIGIGNTLIDLILNETDQFLIDLGKQKGGMDLVESDYQDLVLSKTKSQPVVVTGGSTCNTMVGIGRLGGNVRFIGSRGKDKYGNAFEQQLIDSNVAPDMFIGTMSTGRVLSIVTPDAQRSMFTFLGASVELSPESVSPSMFEHANITMVEGYLLFNPDLIRAALNAAKEAGNTIALDLSSFEVVKAAKPILGELIEEFVDILIANEDEAEAYTGFKNTRKALEVLAQNTQYAVLKVGEKGSYISHKNIVYHIEPVLGDPPMDTTGAGDLWAAGFLYGLANNMSIEKSGHLASACGYEVCQVMGAHLPAEAWERIKVLT